MTEGPNSQRPSAISPDGNWLVVSEAAADTRHDLVLFSLEDESRTAETLLQTRFEERNAEISPDGNWLAYESNPSDRFEVYVRAFPDTERGLQQVSTDGGRMPRWSPDGRELFYWGPGGRMMAVQVEADASLSLGAPSVLFRGPYYEGDSESIARTFDLSPDGERFLMIKGVDESGTEDASPRRINVVVNWFQELEERVPVP